MPNNKILVDIVLISISNPILIGVYENNNLIKEIAKTGKISDDLPTVFKNLTKEYQINYIIYTNSPGSFLGIKLTFIFLKTLNIAKKIKIKAVDGFYFNNNSAIKAIMGKFFVKKNKQIIVCEKTDDMKFDEFYLPKKINIKDFSDDINPIYIVPAVY